MFKDLHFILSFVRDFINLNGIIELYKQLESDFRLALTATAADGATIEARIDETKEKILRIHDGVNLLLMTPPQKAILRHIGAYQIIGPKASIKIRSAISRQATNPNVILQTLTELQTSTIALSSRVQQTSTNLDLDEFEDGLATNKKYVEISFGKHSKFKNFWESAERSRDWSLIFNAVATLTGEKYEDIETISWSSASPTIGVWISGGIKFISALIDLSKFAAKLKKIKDTIFEKEDAADKLGAEVDAVKIVKESIKKNFMGIYASEKEKMTVELKKSYGQNNKRPEGDGDNFIRIALEMSVSLMYDGSKVIDPSEVKPKIEESTMETTSQIESLGQLYKDNHKLGQKVNKFLKAEAQKRLEARTAKMKESLGGSETHKEYTVKELKDLLKKVGLKAYGPKKEMLKRYDDHLKSLDEEKNKTVTQEKGSTNIAVTTEPDAKPGTINPNT